MQNIKLVVSCLECEDSQFVEGEPCQECCPHNEFEHFTCLDCGYEKCPGDCIDRAEYYIDPER